MSEKIPESEHFKNKYDNSDLVMDRNVKDIAAGFTAYDELRAYKEYLETLKLEQELTNSASGAKKIKVKFVKSDGLMGEKEVALADLVSRPSDFESKRRLVLAKLNGMKDIEIKKLLNEFDEDSLWELSAKITNAVIDKKRRDTVVNQFDFDT